MHVIEYPFGSEFDLEMTLLREDKPRKYSELSGIEMSKFR